MNKKYFIIFLLFLLFLGARVFRKTEGASDALVKTCTRTKNPVGCYDREIPKTLTKLSLEEAFAVVGLVKTKDKSFVYCHDVAHNLGVAAVKKNRSQWKKTLSACQFGTCANGCLHGVVEEATRGDKQLLDTICLGNDTWKPNVFEKSHCYMALGAVINYFTDAKIQESLLLCDKITNTPDGVNFARLCYDGVFDQLYRPKESEDAVLVAGVAPTAQTLIAYCEQFVKDPFGHLKKSSCLNQGWPFFKDEVDTPRGLERYCLQQEDPGGQEACFKMLFQRIGPNNAFDRKKIASFCGHIPVVRQPLCLAAAAIQMYVSDKKRFYDPETICDLSPNNSVTRLCRAVVAEYLTAGQEELFCASSSAIFRRAVVP